MIGHTVAISIETQAFDPIRQAIDIVIAIALPQIRQTVIVGVHVVVVGNAVLIRVKGCITVAKLEGIADTVIIAVIGTIAAIAVDVEVIRDTITVEVS